MKAVNHSFAPGPVLLKTGHYEQVDGPTKFVNQLSNLRVEPVKLRHVLRRVIMIIPGDYLACPKIIRTKTPILYVRKTPT